MPEPEAPAGPITVQLGVCSSCDALFLLSGRRPYSGCHGADSILTLATLVLGEDGRITGAWGPDAAPPQPVTAAPAAPPDDVGEPLAAPPPEVDFQEESVALGPPALAQAIYFVQDPELDGTDLRAALLEAGAEAEDVDTAIGRLTAVRDFLQKLAPQGA